MAVRTVGLGIGQQSLPEAGVLHFETAQAVSLGAQVETPGPRPHRLGGGEILRFHLVGLLLHKGVGILGKSAGRRSQQAQMPRVLRQQTLREFQAERRRGLDEIGIIITGISGAALGHGIGRLVQCIAMNGAAAAGKPRQQQAAGNHL